MTQPLSTENFAVILQDWDKDSYPGINFYDIQKIIIKENKEKTGIFLGTGVGKTLTALCLAEGRILVVCPKQQKLDQTWQDNNKKFNLGKYIVVMSKEQFRRDWEKVPQFDTVIFDEGHNMLGVSPETVQRKKIVKPKTSQIFEAAFLYLRKFPPKRFYITTATPVVKPMNMWAIAKLYGFDWDFFKFRTTFYFATMMGRRQVWLPRRDPATQERLAGLIKRFGYTGGLKDFMDVPEQTHKTVHIELGEAQKKAIKELMESEADPLVRRSYQRTIENGVLYGKDVQDISAKESKMTNKTTIFPSGKIDYILERAVEFSKLFVFANYTAQIEEISKALKKDGHKVFTVTGATKDRATVFKEAESEERCVIVVQAQICEGYRVPSAPCMIFASKNYRYVFYEQGIGRILDAEHLKKNLYIHLVVKGGPDEDCHKAIESGKDFQEKLSIT